MKLNREKTHHRVVAALVVIIVVLLVVLYLYFAGFWVIKKHPIVKIPVEATQVNVQPMPVIYQSPGSIESIQMISISAQVTGILKKIDFVPGQKVMKGQLLLEIDPAPFIASLQQAQANLRKDQAQLKQLQTDANRYRILAQKEFVTKQQAEQAQTSADAQVQAVQADQALIKQAQIQLSYANINSPVTGNTGNIVVRVGDLVVANSAQPLITINQSTPMWADFYTPQSLLPNIRAYQQKNNLTVKIYSDDGNTLLDTGKLVFIDNAINLQTGTVLLKAQANNDFDRLWPGQIISAQLIISIDPKAITTPISAVQIDQTGNFVYVIINDKASVRRIKLDRQIGNVAVISKGLKGNETVITKVPPNFIEGSWVSVIHSKQKVTKQ